MSAVDKEAKRAALAKLAKPGSLRLVRALVDGSIDDRLKMFRDMRREGGVNPDVLPVLLHGIDDVTDPERLAVSELLRHRDAKECTAEGIAQVAEYVGRTTMTSRMELRRDSLRMLRWIAGDPMDRSALDPSEDRQQAIALVVNAVIDRMLDADSNEVCELRFDDGLTQLLLCADPARAHKLFCTWLLDAATGDLLMRRLFDIQDMRGRVQPTDRRAVDHVIALWESGAVRTELVAHLHRAVENHRNLDGKPFVFGWLWDRFCRYADEQRDVFHGFYGWRSSLIEHRDRLPRAERPGGQSAASHLALWSRLDFDNVITTMDEALAMASTEQWAGLIEETFLLEPEPTHEQQILAVVVVCKLGRELLNRCNDDEPQFSLHVDAFDLKARQLLSEMKREGLLDQQFRNRLEDVAEVIERIEQRRAERIERQQEQQQREQQARDRANQQEQQQAQTARVIAEAHKQAQRMQRDIMAQQARLAAEMQEQMRAHQQAAATAVAAAVATVAAAAGAVGRWSMPQPMEAIDFEPLFPGEPLMSLIDYCRVMVRMQRGAQPLPLFTEHGLDPTTFAMASQKFSALFASRPELAQRFAALLSATWM
jgi:hypothetical protein